MLENPSPKSWRHCIRFSVRALMVFVLTLGGMLGWIVYQAHVQRDAVLAVQRAGGRVWYDWLCSGNGYVLPASAVTSSFAPVWNTT